MNTHGHLIATIGIWFTLFSPLIGMIIALLGGVVFR
jgi:hypothetical protein